jgi:HlyD family secretion protein
MTYVRERGRIELRKVRIAHNNGVAAEVLEGLSPGEMVVLYPPDDLVDGAAVAPASAGTD